MAKSQVSPGPAGWYADPTGKRTYRYWDGSAWAKDWQPPLLSDPSKVGVAGLVLLLVSAVLGGPQVIPEVWAYGMGIVGFWMMAFAWGRSRGGGYGGFDGGDGGNGGGD